MTKEYYLQNREKIKARAKKWYADNRTRGRTTRRAHYRANLETYLARANETAKKNPERVKETKRRWKINNPERVLELGRRRHAARYRTDLQYNFSRKLRYRIWSAIQRARKGLVKSNVTLGLLGCSFAELKVHIEKQFQPGMDWPTVLAGKIHLDHKRPCASFDLTDAKQQRECFHYTNLQPLWAVDNLKKGATYSL